ncbi:hypothetical protein hmeg3_01690 [Herbaspirillum sp. meg3]|jgi:hypothetical protein|uniref:DUF2076 domain-containing protein n=1 Tax=Herbaspirillum sp. meg3 TaxID=2025949 RepID=UPI000B991A2A|nr:DUF2076 domain-containing protein [Herbaspirillum sp. meg3]ASU37130.1 hypothetical protein hmeg3_01690 [Herbaspirillum sp. meg3]
MNPQETQMLQDFLNQLTQVRGIGKDAQADAMIAAAVAQQPDAAYLLVQRALLMDQALATSKTQIAALQSQVQALQSGATPARGFLDGNTWGNTPAASVRSEPAPAYAPVYASPPASAPAQMAPQYQAAPTASSGFFGGGMGSMLGTVAATAAGVAGGAFLYQGIEHLMNGNSSSFGSARQNGLSSPVENVENTTVNNYYGDNADKTRGQDRDDSGSGMASNNDLADLGNIDLDDSSDSGSYDDSMV